LLKAIRCPSRSVSARTPSQSKNTASNRAATCVLYLLLIYYY
jgi:hypothetical protein